MDKRITSGGEGLWLYFVPFIANQGRSSFMESSNLSHLTLWPLYLALVLVALCVSLVCWAVPGGPAWGTLKGRRTIPGPRGWPILGSLLDMGGQAHRNLAALALQYKAHSLMAISLGSTRVVVASKPDVARELLCSSGFADRPLKQSAQQLLFGRAIGFAPYGEYWRKLRRVAATHLFSPKRLAGHERHRQAEASALLEAIASESVRGGGSILLRPFLQRASLNNIMLTVFGKRYDFQGNPNESWELQDMVREGFELLGAFNMADHLPALRSMDPSRIHQRCAMLVPRVNTFVQAVINEHRYGPRGDEDESDFVDILLALQTEEQLTDSDMISILWEMIFRGTDTMAILIEWILAELLLNEGVQKKLHAELDRVVHGRDASDADIGKLPYLQAVVKETLRLHPPGPLLSWARLATRDVNLAGHDIPAGTTAMVNMWAITHDPNIWEEPEKFKPERFSVIEGGIDIDIRGGDLRLAPFGAGRRVCPGKALGLATVNLWLARLLQRFQWVADSKRPVDLTEVLKLSCEMAKPLSACPIDRYMES
eukprot:c7232_g1_i2 orf=396-2021(-)